jgi:retron-type reverse transcriptase
MAMARRHNDLFVGIANFHSLHDAAKRAIAGKRKKLGAAAFMSQLEPNLISLERELLEGSYRTGRYLEIVVRDPKRRLVSAAPFRDRVVHHALHNAVGPIFERGFIDDTYANRVGKGTHRALNRYEHYRDRHKFVLRCDIFRYFPSIDHAVLKADLRRRIACTETLWLLDTIIDGSNPQEQVQLLFPGDDLLTSLERRRGLPLGNLTSQFFANVYLDNLDHYCKEVLRAPYVRYVDDFALFSDNEQQLEDWRNQITVFLEKRRLRLHPAKTGVHSCTDPAPFLGFITAPGRHRRLPDINVTRFANRLRVLRARWVCGDVAPHEVRQRINAWVAHAQNANTVQLRHTLFAGGWFDPYWADGTPAKARIP